jgi:hypothetical protein
MGCMPHFVNAVDMWVTVGGGLIIRLSKTLLNKIFHQEVKNVL